MANSVKIEKMVKMDKIVDTFHDFTFVRCTMLWRILLLALMSNLKKIKRGFLFPHSFKQSSAKKRYVTC